jgi:3,4-dihydroxy 2-butanone 4-phosphate synthase/GTP cyclohydrolase II
MAGLAPCAVICEVLNDDGTIARGPELDRLAADQGLARVTIEDLVAYRRSVLRPGVRVSLVT